MKNLRTFWALPAFLRLSLAFSVQDDLLAFPQYEVQFPDSIVPESYASSRLALAASQSSASSASSSTATPPDSKETQELSKARGAGANIEDDPDAPVTYEHMILKGQPFLCRIPIVEAQQGQNDSSHHSAEEEEKELMRATDRGWELLQGMQGDCIYYLSGWWSYSFCYNKEVKQFHQLPPGRGVPHYPPVEDTQVQSFVLGKFPKKEQAKDGKKAGKDGQEVVDDEVDDAISKGTMEVAKLQTKGETRYMVQKLGGGTTCDLTGKERKIEVQFHCNPSSGDKIGMIKEVSTCSYLMVIYTPRLCNDIAFLPAQENKPNAITCRAIFPDNTDFDSVPQHPLVRSAPDSEGAEAAEDAARQESGQGEDSLTSATKPLAPLPTVGGVVVGAKASVGSPGKVIEKSVVVGGGKETLLGTVCNSEGKMMSEREMRKLGIKDPANVDKLKRDLKRLSDGKPWRLDLVDTPRGREFRGIIEGDDEKDDTKKKPKKDTKDEPGAAAGKAGQGGGGGDKPAEPGAGDSEEGSEETYKEEL